MNERIKQLAEQAKEVSHWLDGGYTPVYHTNLEKFAELIVRECIQVINQHRFGDDDVIRISYDVEQHFGVEE